MIIFEKEDMKEEQPICLLHIPKTGGKTLWKILNEQPETYYVWHKKMFKRLVNPVTFFTMLRDPVDRVLSTYYYIRAYEADPLHLPLQSITLREFVDYISDDQIENIRYEIGDLRSLRFRSVNLATRYLSGGDPNALNKAKMNIKNHFSFVGITDMYSESLFLMKKRFNLHIQSVIVQNKTKNRPSLDSIAPDTIDKIKKINHTDIAVYEWAIKRFLSKLRSLSTQEQQELKAWLTNN
ncbi:sulfotransferase family 2 domain-containing protein [Gracilibacillus massiliensis]|uniref:sulfotransferase family 2 domain-containing protein n=1 Tax=Gracilibacillus massiliensis TaxID=1564956 RepID=UPI00071DD1DB|nr:sulfotransferase family 2 domain-containing protein [Gracilibacillus massiliensis]